MGNRLENFIARLLPRLCISLFLAPCIQQKLSIAVNVLFLVMLALNWFYKGVFSYRNLGVERKKRLSRKCSIVNSARAIVTFIAALTYSAAASWKLFSLNTAGGNSARVLEIENYFSLAQSLTWLTFAATAVAEVRGVHIFASKLERTFVHIWWVITFILASIQIASLLIRSIESCPSPFITERELFVTITSKTVNFIASSVLVVTAFSYQADETSQEIEMDRNTEAEEPLLLRTNAKARDIGGYSESSWLSRLTWNWILPLLQKGYQTRLEVDDVPALAAQDDAQNLYERFAQAWDKSEGSGNRVGPTVVRSLQWQFIRTGVLALCRVSVMYIGPALITTFVYFKSKSGGALLEGCLLVLVLAVSKCVDVLASHHFNFECQKLGMAIRSTLITVVYRKGLRLTNSARLSHGLGQIVNYMSVDVQMLADVILQIHNLWLLPIQVGIALGILYSVVGLSMLAGLLTMVAIVAFATWSSKRQRYFQGFIMKARDKRMKGTSESLNSMKVIKLQAWESHFRGHIEMLRDQEYHWILKYMFQIFSSTVFIWCAPSIVSVATFACCLLLEGTELTPGQVFTAVATFRVLQEPIRNFPQTMIAVSQAQVSLDRLDRYLRSEELHSNAVDRAPIGDGEDLAIYIDRASFSWTKQDASQETTTMTLRDIDLKVKKGALIAVVGTVGSGKSSLLACILGEVPKLYGKVCVEGTTAYVPQTAWIQSGSIQENILFGQQMHGSRYSETLRVCALEPDMALFEHGDQTEIGERGINLSGGQKQRIQLARAVYQDCDIYLLDDIFSAVDAHTGSAIFKDCVKGVLSKKTVILVTHQIDFLHEADTILVMRDGVVAQCGKYAELLGPGTELEALVVAHKESLESVESEQPVDLVKQISTEAHVSLNQVGTLERISSVKETTQHFPNGLGTSAKQGSAKLVEEEQREIGHVSWSIYWLYMTKAYGSWSVVLQVIVQTLMQAFTLASDYWLANETSDGQRSAFHPGRFIGVYAILSLATWLCVVFRSFGIIWIGVKTTQEFYLQMLRSIFRAPMAFFDTTPSGRILSRVLRTNENMSRNREQNEQKDQVVSAVKVQSTHSLSPQRARAKGP